MEWSDDCIREGGRLFIYFAKVTSANIVFEMVPHSHPVEVVGGVFEAFLCSHVCHLFVGNSDDFAPDVISFIGCFIGNIWTVSTVILPSFEKKSINNYPAGVVWFLLRISKRRSEVVAFLRLLYHFPLRCWESWKARTSRALEGSSGKGSS